MNIPDIKYFNSRGAKGGEKNIKRLFPEFYTYINEKIHELPWREKIYCFYHNLSTPPKCECGNPVKFINFVEGYTKY